MCIRDRWYAAHNEDAIQLRNKIAAELPEFEVRNGGTTTIDITPVSYTHLDVYKRQEYTLTARTGFFVLTTYLTSHKQYYVHYSTLCVVRYSVFYANIDQKKPPGKGEYEDDAIRRAIMARLC